jgi:hypothetical protein
VPMTVTVHFLTMTTYNFLRAPEVAASIWQYRGFETKHMYTLTGPAVLCVRSRHRPVRFYLNRT